MTSQTKYDLRVTVTDRAENSTIGTNTASTSRHEKNPGGVITDITSIDIVYAPRSDGFGNVGKTIDYTFEPKTVTFSQNLSGAQTSIECTNNTTWFVLGETYEDIFIVTLGPRLRLKGVAGFNNGVGLLDAIADTGYVNTDYVGITGRNLKIDDTGDYWSGGLNTITSSTTTLTAAPKFLSTLPIRYERESTDDQPGTYHGTEGKERYYGIMSTVPYVIWRNGEHPVMKHLGERVSLE